MFTLSHFVVIEFLACSTVRFAPCPRVGKTTRVEVLDSVLVGISDFNTSLDGWASVLPFAGVRVTQGRSLDFGRGAWASPFTGGRGSSEAVRESGCLALRSVPRASYRKVLASLIGGVEHFCPCSSLWKPFYRLSAERGFTPSKLLTSARRLRLQCLAATRRFLTDDVARSSDRGLVGA